MTTYHSSVTTPLREGLKAMLREFVATHSISIKFHESMTLRRATERIATWHRHVLRRLFGRHWKSLPASTGPEFLLLPEIETAAHLHYHGLIRIPATHAGYFERVAPQLWKRVSPKGTFHLISTRANQTEREGWFTYITKESTAQELLHSSMVHVPDAFSRTLGPNQFGAEAFRRTQDQPGSPQMNPS